MGGALLTVTDCDRLPPKTTQVKNMDEIHGWTFIAVGEHVVQIVMAFIT